MLNRRTVAARGCQITIHAIHRGLLLAFRRGLGSPNKNCLKPGGGSCLQQSWFSVRWVLVLPADTAYENEYPVVVGKPRGKHIMSGIQKNATRG